MSDDEKRRKITTPPTLTNEQVKILLTKHFPRVAGETGLDFRLEPLDSYDDKNFLLRFGNGAEMVLKVVNGVDSENDGFLEAQMAALRQLRRCGVMAPLDVSDVRKTSDHELILRFEGSAMRYAVRLLTYLRGTLLYDYHLARARDWEARVRLHRELGENVAGLTLALREFRHPATENRGLIWDLERFESVAKDFFSYAGAGNRGDMLERVLATYRRDFSRHRHGMRRQVIHNDLNDRNIVRLAEGASPRYGFLDLGDMVYSYTVFEISICLAYVVISYFAIPSAVERSRGETVHGWAELAGAVFSSYDALAPLAEPELRAVYACVLSRLATSVSLGAYSLALNPGNAEYLSIHSAPAWKALEVLLSDEAREVFNRDVLGGYCHSSSL